MLYTLQGEHPGDRKEGICGGRSTPKKSTLMASTAKTFTPILSTVPKYPLCFGLLSLLAKVCARSTG